MFIFIVASLVLGNGIFFAFREGFTSHISKEENKQFSMHEFYINLIDERNAMASKDAMCIW